MKICSKCKIEKPKTEFSKHSKAKEILRPSCKACQCAYSRAYREENPEKVAEYSRAYRAANPGKASEWRKANPDKAAAWYDAHAEKLCAKARAWRKANPEQAAALSRAWQKANPAKVAASRRAYDQAHPETQAAINRNRRARKRNAEGSHTVADIRAILDKQMGLCANCNTKLLKSGKHKFHVDHIQALARGGSNDKYNLQCLCPSCNKRKNAKDPYDWAAEQGRLL